MTKETTFFSYSRTDAAFVLKLANDLRDAGAELWLDQLDIKAGSHWDTSVEAALNSAQRLIVVLSPASVASDNVMDEVSFAMKNGKTVIPILLGKCTIPFRLIRLQHIDFTVDYQTGLNNLIKVLGSAAADNLATVGKSNKGPVKKSSLKKYILFGGGTVLIALGLWWALNSQSAKKDEQKIWTQALQKNDSSSYALYLKEFPNGAYYLQAKEKLNSIWNKKISDSIAPVNNNLKQDSPVAVDKKTQLVAIKTKPVSQKKPNTLQVSSTSQECPVWQSNLTIIKKTYSHMLGEGGKTYTNRAALRQVVSNIVLNSDENLNKMKKKLLSLIDNAPSHSDPNYDMEFTQEASLIRDQIDMDIQKHVDKCK